MNITAADGCPPLDALKDLPDFNMAVHNLIYSGCKHALHRFFRYFNCIIDDPVQPDIYTGSLGSFGDFAGGLTLNPIMMALERWPGSHPLH